MKRMTTLFVGLVLSITGAPLAQADQGDDTYLAAVAGMGLSIANRDALIAGGHASCDGQGNPLALLGAQGQLVGAGVPYGSVTQVEVAAARVYCPDKLHAAGLS
jgi:hypothetical protein